MGVRFSKNAGIMRVYFLSKCGYYAGNKSQKCGYLTEKMRVLCGYFKRYNIFSSLSMHTKVLSFHSIHKLALPCPVKRVFSKHRPSGPMLSISRNVRPCVCLSVCLCVCSLLRYRLTVFLPPLPEVGCPIFLEIRNPWEKVMERSGVTFKHFCLELV